MNTKLNFDQQDGNLVYVKPVAVADLPQEVQEKAEGLTQIFAVHNAEGEQLALVADKNLAFELARQHDMSPMTVH
ncbi:DUF1150 family protein [Roseisalinus antarcticus]|uniref:DUF1150 domain-containing protein n=1 Tax=Roseisalinus antarcticus TaxID=254357 RepID=A0A1Y5TU46_9RHOB|nr:DUF1150 family protein [Roseisalinus antarcticus]SLN72355.1 hypothetical protein ROA7023_03592 [Roseisalinus antarcticus]